MLLVDSAVGSRELVEPLRKLGLPAELTHLDFGDICFLGRGEKGANLLIGIEFKKIGELITSLTTERLQGHQLRGMLRTFDRSYLLVEGDFGHDKLGRVVAFRGKGELKPLKGGIMAGELEKRLINLQTRGGLISRHVTTRRDTLRVISAWYRYWTDKTLDAHKSHMAIYAPDLDRALCVPVSDFRKGLVAMCPGLGFALSQVIEKRVWDKEKGEGSLRKLMRLSAADIPELKVVDRNGNTKRIGHPRTKAIMEALK